MGQAALLLTFIDQRDTGEKPATAARKHGIELEVMTLPSAGLCGAAQLETEARSGPCSRRRRRANPRPECHAREDTIAPDQRMQQRRSDMGKDRGEQPVGQHRVEFT